MVWEYAVDNRYIDGVWFPDDACSEAEERGNAPSKQRAIGGAGIVICEAKKHLSPELIGQATAYRELAARAGATVRQTFIFAERGDSAMLYAAERLGLIAVVSPLDSV